VAGSIVHANIISLLSILSMIAVFRSFIIICGVASVSVSSAVRPKGSKSGRHESERVATSFLRPANTLTLGF